MAELKPKMVEFYLDQDLVVPNTTLTSSSDYLLVDRNRPPVTDTNRELVRQGWGDQPTVAQRNPLVAIEYNQFMGSVDQDNQLRAEHACTLRSHRNWL
jgi:hypothetical protein